MSGIIVLIFVHERQGPGILACRPCTGRPVLGLESDFGRSGLVQYGASQPSSSKSRCLGFNSKMALNLDRLQHLSWCWRAWLGIKPAHAMFLEILSKQRLITGEMQLNGSKQVLCRVASSNKNPTRILTSCTFYAAVLCLELQFEETQWFQLAATATMEIVYIDDINNRNSNFESTVLVMYQL